MDFDWVRERASCSARQMFEKLKLEIKTDVDTRNELRGEQRHYKFQIVSSGKGFTVWREGNQLSAAVEFSLDGDNISVKKDDGSTVIATVSMNDEGECHFRVSGKEQKSWQLRKDALEEIFFIGL